MSGKLNQVALKDYSGRFTSKVLTDFYQTRQTASGQELLTLTPSRQINLGIISALFDQWKANAEAFRSPYFDFEHEEVKRAMRDFMNTVSQHIAIGRDDLQPLLLAATTDALLLLLAPADYFEQKLKALPNFTYDAESAQKLSKYTHIHAGVARALALRLTDSGSDFVYVNKALDWLSEILAGGTSLDAVHAYVEEFSRVLPLDISQIVPADVAAVPVPEVAKPVGSSFFDTALAEATTAGPAFRNPVPEPPAARPVLPPSPRPSVESTTLNSHYKVDVPPPLEETTYGSVQVKVDSILKSIPLGHRFMFVNQLFNRESDAFDKAIQALDQAATFEEARSLLTGKYAPLYGWDMNSEAVQDLMTLVKRKFN